MFRIVMISPVDIEDVSDRTDLNFELSFSLTGKGAGSFTINCPKGSVIPQVGYIIEVYKNDDFVFYGMITRVVPPRFPNKTLYKITTTDPKGMTENRIPKIAEGNIAFEFLIRKITRGYLAEDGISKYRIDGVDDSVIKNFYSYNDSIYKILNNLCAMVNAFWYVSLSQRGKNTLRIIGKEKMSVKGDEYWGARLEKVREKKDDNELEKYTNITMFSPIIPTGTTKMKYKEWPSYIPKVRPFDTIETDSGELIYRVTGISVRREYYTSGAIKNADMYECSLPGGPNNNVIREITGSTQATPYDLFYYTKGSGYISLNTTFNGILRNQYGLSKNYTFDYFMNGFDSRSEENVTTVRFYVYYEVAKKYYREVEIPSGIQKISEGAYSGRIDKGIESYSQDTEFESEKSANDYMANEIEYYNKDIKKMSLTIDGNQLSTSADEMQYKHIIYGNEYYIDKKTIRPIIIGDDELTEVRYDFVNKELQPPVRVLAKNETYSKESIEYGYNANYRQFTDIATAEDEYTLTIEPPPPYMHITDNSGTEKNNGQMTVPLNTWLY